MQERKMKTFVLKVPIMVDNQEVTEVKLPERLKGKELRALDKADGKVESMFYLIEKASGIPFACIDEMDAEDIGQFQDHVNSFLSQGTGDN
ncbi:MAG: phage tail assembly protein [Planctomycetota bacterium]